MLQVFPKLWVSWYGESPWASDGHGHGDAWARAVWDLSEEQLEAGIDAVVRGDGRQKPTLPPTPPEFRQICLPHASLSGIPDKWEAFLEACRNANPVVEPHWSHGVVLETFRRVGRYHLQQDEKHARQAWAHYWDRVVAEFQRGELPDRVLNPPKIGRQRSESVTDPDEAKEKIGEIRAMLEKKAPDHGEVPGPNSSRSDDSSSASDGGQE